MEVIEHYRDVGMPQRRGRRRIMPEPPRASKFFLRFSKSSLLENRTLIELSQNDFFPGYGLGQGARRRVGARLVIMAALGIFSKDHIYSATVRENWETAMSTVSQARAASPHSPLPSELPPQAGSSFGVGGSMPG